LTVVTIDSRIFIFEPAVWWWAAGPLSQACLLPLDSWSLSGSAKADAAYLLRDCNGTHTHTHTHTHR